LHKLTCPSKISTLDRSDNQEKHMNNPLNVFLSNEQGSGLH
jgi:hypothetical protein